MPRRQRFNMDENYKKWESILGTIFFIFVIIVFVAIIAWVVGA